MVVIRDAASACEICRYSTHQLSDTSYERSKELLDQHAIRQAEPLLAGKLRELNDPEEQETS
jgi:hypothetical protein